jgi:2'-5' RNA ligase
MAEPEQGPTIETYISAVRGALKWANPPVPEGVSPEDWHATLIHAFDVVAAAARDNVRNAQASVAPNRAARRKPPAKPAKPPAKPARK